ncbi:MAG: cupredoxin domain-containing protein [Nitrospiraceae bacterium]|nr:cupredoxin domain-containing protein [Nitrospiraceae bacterium]
MKRKTAGRLAVLFVLQFVFAGCAHLQKPVSAGTGAGTKVVEMTAESYKFTPNNIWATEGGVIVFRIKNVSSITHDFTLKNPDGRTIADSDLPAGKTTEVRADFSKPGRYEYLL